MKKLYKLDNITIFKSIIIFNLSKKISKFSVLSSQKNKQTNIPDLYSKKKFSFYT